MTRWQRLRLRLTLWRLYPPWQAHRVTLRLQKPPEPFGWRPYWAYVNVLQGQRYMLGPVAMYPKLSELLKVAHSQALRLVEDSPPNPRFRIATQPPKE